MLVWCLGGLVAGSTLAAVSAGGGWFGGLLAGRVVQGLSGGVFPLAFALARSSVRPRRLVAVLSAMFGVGGALGMVLAGPVVDLLGTPWLFWLTLVLALAALAGVPVLPRSRPDSRAVVLDVPGALLLSMLLVALLLGISRGSALALVAALVVGVVFVVVELRAPEPVVDLRLLRRVAVVNSATLVISVALFAAVTVIPRVLQSPALGLSAGGTGAVLVPMAVCMVLVAPLAHGPTGFRLGAALACAGLGFLGFAHARLWEFLVGGAVLGAAYGFAFAALGNLVVGAVPPERTGAATGVNTILRTTGGALGAQVAGTVSDSGAVFLVAAVVAGVALLLSAGLP